MALDDFYDLNNDYKTRLVLHKRHSDNVISAASTVIDLLETDEVVAIIGPQSSIEATFAIELGRQVQVPIITFSVTSPSISHAKNPYFIRTAQNDSYQVQALTELIQGFDWHEIVLIYEDTVYGNGIIPYLTDALLKSNIKITYKCAFLKEASSLQIFQELNQMRGLKTQVFLVHMMTTSRVSQLFEHAKDVGLMSEGYAWIITDELNIFGLWAYDTIWALAQAVEDISPLHSPLYTNLPNNDSNPITSLGKSQDGPRLLNSILNSKPLLGLSGEFHIVNGQLEPLALEIFNVIGNGERVIGYWNPKNGISRSLHSLKRPSPSSVDNLKKIIWPGDSTMKPLGLGIPRILQKLKIGVPKKDGFPGLVQIKLNQTTKEIIYQGYCIDVFRAAIDALPYSMKFDYELQYYSFNIPSKNSNYDELLYQVHNKTFDAVVGDISIVASRWYVDFTLPFSDSGVSMVVSSTPMHRNNGDMFIFFKPFSWVLWLAIALTFVFVYFAMCFLRLIQNENGNNVEVWHLLGIPLASLFTIGKLFYAHI
ncbi:hypothetical protein QQ045_029235 [Rhodiola kirilowii]